MKRDKVLRELTTKEVAEYISELNEKRGMTAVQHRAKVSIAIDS